MQTTSFFKRVKHKQFLTEHFAYSNGSFGLTLSGHLRNAVKSSHSNSLNTANTMRKEEN